MAQFLTVHTTYKDVQIGIFQDQNLISLISEDNKKISRNFLCLIENLLKKNNLSIENLDFIAAHKGPAPFTTLRVSLASINGLSFASKIPLIGINGLESMIEDHKDKNNITVVLLNAFCQDIYYAYNIPENPETAGNSESFIGFDSAINFLENMYKNYSGHFKFIGNGSDLYREDIKKIFQKSAIIEDPLPEITTIESIAKNALIKWQSHQQEKQLIPVYLKSSSPKIEIPRI